MPDKFYLTTPIYYVNARPHIGHAYTTIVADVVARRHRLLGHDTWFLTGTDEHGQKIERSALAAGIPPQEFADQVSQSFQDLWKRMGITNDQFIRTTDPAHKRGVQKLFSTLLENGAIYLSTYTGQYCVSEEMFVEGPPGTIGPDGRPTETVTEENYFFRLSAFQQPLIDLIESNTLKIENDARRNEVLSFLRGGLKDLSISRTSFTWGIPVPGEKKTTQDHIIYVWLDALANYMTAIGYGSDDTADQAKFARYWPADLHLVGKEIIRFHCVYWPAFLLALNPETKGKAADELPVEAHRAWAKDWLPKSIVAHGWLLFEDSKMSKSRGNIVRTETILDAFGPLCPPPPPSGNTGLLNSTGLQPRDSHAGREGALAPGTPSSARPPTSPLLSSRSAAEGSASPATSASKHEQDLFAADVLRYFLLREIPFGQDGSFSFDALVQRYNSDLANGYGNLVSRTLSMIKTNCDGKIPACHAIDPTLQEPVLSDLRGVAGFGVGQGQIERMLFTQALVGTFGMITHVDEFISRSAPWKLAKSDRPVDRQKLQTVLYHAAESIRIITALLHPILPYATSKVWNQLGLDPAQLTTDNQQLTTLTWGGLRPGTKLGTLAPIFPRAPKELIQLMTDMETQPKTPDPRSSAQSAVVLPEPASTAAHAGPRTATLAEENPGAKVAGSHALSTERTGTPPHTEAHASGVFATAPAPTGNVLPTTDNAPITIDDFVKIDLRVAQIVVAERIPKADKLLRLEVDLGPAFGRRQILSGIAEWYTPEELLGRRIAVIANLAPRKMRGLDSHGMLLAASDDTGGAHGKPILASFSDEVPLGSRIR